MFDKIQKRVTLGFPARVIRSIQARSHALCVQYAQNVKITADEPALIMACGLAK